MNESTSKCGHVFETNVLTTQDNDMYEDPRENLDDSYEPPPSHRVFTTAPSASFSRGEYLGRCIAKFFCCLFIDGFVFLYVVYVFIFSLLTSHWSIYLQREILMSHRWLQNDALCKD